MKNYYLLLFCFFCFFQISKAQCPNPINPTMSIAGVSYSSGTSCNWTLGSSQDAIVCVLSLTGGASGGSGNYTYTWTVNGSGSVTYPYIYICFRGSTNYVVWVTLTVTDNVQGCSETIRESINPDAYCSGQQIKKTSNDTWKTAILNGDELIINNLSELTDSDYAVYSLYNMNGDLLKSSGVITKLSDKVIFRNFNEENRFSTFYILNILTQSSFRSYKVILINR